MLTFVWLVPGFDCMGSGLLSGVSGIDSCVSGIVSWKAAILKWESIIVRQVKCVASDLLALWIGMGTRTLNP